MSAGVCKRMAAEVESRFPKTLAKRKAEVAVDVLQIQQLEEQEKAQRIDHRLG